MQLAAAPVETRRFDPSAMSIARRKFLLAVKTYVKAGEQLKQVEQRFGAGSVEFAQLKMGHQQLGVMMLTAQSQLQNEEYEAINSVDAFADTLIDYGNEFVFMIAKTTPVIAREAKGVFDALKKGLTDVTSGVGGALKYAGLTIGAAVALYLILRYGRSGKPSVAGYFGHLHRLRART